MSNGLIVSGGGSKGAFAVGAIEVLREEGITFDLVSGTSTGALVAPLVATDDIPVLRAVYGTVHTDDILLRRDVVDILLSDSIYDTRPLWQLIGTVLHRDRYQEVVDSAMEVFITTVNLQTGGIEYWNQHSSGPLAPGSAPDGGALDYESFVRAVMASASQPVLMPPIRVPEGSGNQYVDGGVREYAPLKIAIDNGVTDIYSIVLSPEEGATGLDNYRFVLDTFLRTLGVVLEEIGENDVRQAVLYNHAVSYHAEIRARAAELLSADEVRSVFDATDTPDPFRDARLINLWVIRPTESLTSDSLEFDPIEMARMMELGRAAARSALESGPLR